MTTNKSVEEVVDAFFEYQSEGYSGGEQGLRCNSCDRKYSGTGEIEQLCPQCRVRQALQSQRDIAVGEVKKTIEERITASELLIESAEKGQDLEDGWTPEERIDHETSVKMCLESLLQSLTNKQQHD